VNKGYDIKRVLLSYSHSKTLANIIF